MEQLQILQESSEMAIPVFIFCKYSNHGYPFNDIVEYFFFLNSFDRDIKRSKVNSISESILFA